jgi:hypothetical protein
MIYRQKATCKLRIVIACNILRALPFRRRYRGVSQRIPAASGSSQRNIAIPRNTLFPGSPLAVNGVTPRRHELSDRSFRAIFFFFFFFFFFCFKSLIFTGTDWLPIFLFYPNLEP